MRSCILRLVLVCGFSVIANDNLHHDRKCPITTPISTFTKRYCSEYKRIKVKQKHQFKAKYRDQAGRIREITKLQKPTFKRKCVKYQSKNQTSYQTTYTCCPGWTGSDCKTQYLTVATLDRLTSQINDLENKLIKSNKLNKNLNKNLSEKTNKLKQLERIQHQNITDLKDKFDAYEMRLSEIVEFDVKNLPIPDKIRSKSMIHDHFLNRMQADSPVLVVAGTKDDHGEDNYIEDKHRKHKKSPYDQIYQDRLLSQNTLVPILTNSEVCRLEYNSDGNPQQLISQGTTVMCKLPVECSHYFYHPFDCCPKCCPHVDTALMYKKSQQVFTNLDDCPGLEHSEICYHWRQDEWYDKQQLKLRNLEQCEGGCRVDGLKRMDRLCCDDDCLE